MHILTIATDVEFSSPLIMENWLKVFNKLKDYLFVAIWDPELVDQTLIILNRFFTADQLKFQIYEDSREFFLKTLEMLCQFNQEACKQKFKAYVKQVE